MLILYWIFGLTIILATGLALTGKGRYLIKGLSNLFFVDIAKTPRGAEAIYTQAIEEATTAYTKASNNLQRIAGLLHSAKSNSENTARKIQITEKKCEDFAKRNMRKEVELYAQELTTLKEDLAIYQAEIEKYTPMFNDAQILLNNYEQKVKQLKKDKQLVVHQLEINAQTKEMYDDLDELKHAKTSDEMLSHVKEGVLETAQTAVGAKVLHESKLSTKLALADRQQEEFSTKEYVESIMKKYNE